MRCLLRIKNPKKTAVDSYRETLVDKPAITIGRAAAEDLRLAEDDLRVALHHAVIGQVGRNEFAVQSLAPSGIWHNDELVKTASLADGDKIRIGNYQIKVGGAVPEYDLVLTVEPTRIIRERTLPMPKSFRLLDKIRRNLRTLAWSLVAGTVILFFLLPLLGFAVPAIGNFMRDYLTPVSDSAWNPGSSNRSHEYFAGDCSKCHTAAFIPVKDAACKECHKDVKRHTKKDESKIHEPECSDCHKEHQGPAGVIYEAQGLCLDCHEDIKKLSPNSEVVNVKGGFPEKHPDFRISIPLVSLMDGTEKIVRVSMEKDAKLVDGSGLFFSHKSHLKPEGIKKPDSEDKPVVMKCADCHTPEPGGKLMSPIRFEQHCHSCHKLTFDTFAPTREVPHGQPEEVLAILRSYHSDYVLECRKNLLDQAPSVNPEAGARIRPGAEEESAGGTSPAEDCAAPRLDAGGRQRPGAGCEDPDGDYNAKSPLPDMPVPELPEELKDVCKNKSAHFQPETLAQTQDWIEQSAEVMRKNMLFNYRACGQCHDRKPDNGDIVPPKLAKSWLPKARFDHSRHKPLKCSQCHEAEKSKSSRDVLIKGIDTCRECHSDAGGEGKTRSTCISCHGYHVAEDIADAKHGGGEKDATGLKPE